MNYIITCYFSAMILVTLLPLCPSDHWFFRVWEFPRLQIVALLIGLLILCSIFLHDEWRLIACFATSAMLIYQLIWIFPYSRFFATEVASAKQPQRTLKIMTSNVLMTNRDFHKLIDLVNQVKPDVLVTLETDQRWQEAMAPLHEQYEFRVNVPLSNLYGMHVLSKLALENIEIKELQQAGVPSVHCDLRYDHANSITLYFTHPAPPSPTENEEATARDKELLQIAKEVDANRPTIVTGDLNDVAWSPTTREFRHVSGLLDPRIGRGFFNTFHAQYPFARWPLDHLFHSKHFSLVRIERLADIGSDHFPLLTELSFDQRTTEKSHLEDRSKSEL